MNLPEAASILVGQSSVKWGKAQRGFDIRKMTGHTDVWKKGISF